MFPFFLLDSLFVFTLSHFACLWTFLSCSLLTSKPLSLVSFHPSVTHHPSNTGDFFYFFNHLVCWMYDLRHKTKECWFRPVHLSPIPTTYPTYKNKGVAIVAIVAIVKNCYCSYCNKRFCYCNEYVDNTYGRGYMTHIR